MRERYFLSSVTRISDLAASGFAVGRLPRSQWATGDYVVGEVLSWSSGHRVELQSGRTIEVAEGDLVVGAFGVRHATLEATGSWRKIGDDGVMSTLAGGGVFGKCTSRSMTMSPLPKLTYAGHVLVDDAKVGMRDSVQEPARRGYDVPTVLVIGTSMSAGKTTAARVLIRQLKKADCGVLGAKLAGAGRYRDILTMGDAGADWILDFVDGGLPSTVCPGEIYREVLDGLLSRMAGTGADVAVVEVGASPLEPYNGEQAVEALGDAIRATVLCASDPYAVLGVMEAYGTRPDLVTGIASNTLAGIELVESLTGVPAINVRRKDSLPRLRAVLRETLDVRFPGT